MATLAGVEADDKNCITVCTDADNCIVTAGYWKFKRFPSIIKILIVYAHTPYKIVIIGNMLLVGLFF